MKMSSDVTLDKSAFTMTSFQSKVAVWCKYSSSETDNRIASLLYDSSLQLAVVS